MKTKILTKEALFYSKGFREDLQALFDLDDKKFEMIVDWLKQITKFSQIGDPDELIEISRTTKLSIDDISKCFRANIFIALKGADEKVSTEDIINDIVDANIMSPEDPINRIRLLNSYLQKIVFEKVKKTQPKLPLKYIKKINTKCIFISEFESVFDITENKPETYKPIINSVHPAITLELNFEDEENAPLGILLNQEDLVKLIKWLELSKIELSIASKIIPNKLLIMEDGA
ncbi:MAG: hypothetical protein MUO72_18630 [Bacteroidales bacterium]|nr:hypothetical protein [Bacteroidales bacterium]